MNDIKLSVTPETKGSYSVTASIGDLHVNEVAPLVDKLLKINDIQVKADSESNSPEFYFNRFKQMFSLELSKFANNISNPESNRLGQDLNVLSACFLDESDISMELHNLAYETKKTVLFLYSLEHFRYGKTFNSPVLFDEFKYPEHLCDAPMTFARSQTLIDYCNTNQPQHENGNDEKPHTDPPTPNRFYTGFISIPKGLQLVGLEVVFRDYPDYRILLVFNIGNLLNKNFPKCNFADLISYMLGDSGRIRNNLHLLSRYLEARTVDGFVEALIEDMVTVHEVPRTTKQRRIERKGGAVL